MMISLENAAELLQKHDSFLLTAHVNPDGDAIGSTLALAVALKSIGKSVSCFIDDEIPSNFHFLKNIELIDDKAKLPDKAAADLLVIMDSSDRRRIGRVGSICGAPVLNIDHHISNDGFADYCLLDSNAAATGEIVFRLLQAMNIAIDEAVAECLYMAIATDCGFFRYSNTTPETMRIGAALLEKGIEPHKISEAMEQKPLSAVRSLGKALGTLEFFADNKVACMLLDYEFVRDCETTEGFIDIVRTIEGLDLAILIKAVEPNLCRVSMRSKEMDVSKIALALGGGGHKKAAGCTIEAGLNDAKEALLELVLRQMEG
jgi:phosphoesterase RecJ-like protein